VNCRKEKKYIQLCCKEYKRSITGFKTDNMKTERKLLISSYGGQTNLFRSLISMAVSMGTVQTVHKRQNDAVLPILKTQTGRNEWILYTRRNPELCPEITTSKRQFSLLTFNLIILFDKNKITRDTTNAHN
jgi:hypothetical protein